jgi:hypothetical protein
MHSNFNVEIDNDANSAKPQSRICGGPHDHFSAVVQPLAVSLVEYFRGLPDFTCSLSEHTSTMSFKAKDLHFGMSMCNKLLLLADFHSTDSEQPAFLRRLRGELTSGDSARHEQPIARNKRMKKDDDEDDAPTYVLEDTKESLTKEEYDALVSGKDYKEKEEAEDSAKQGGTESESKPKDKIAEVGAASKKRKAAKIVNEEHEEVKPDASKDGKQADSKGTKKPKKKAKAVKLTFGEDEE